MIVKWLEEQETNKPDEDTSEQEINKIEEDTSEQETEQPEVPES